MQLMFAIQTTGLAHHLARWVEAYRENFGNVDR
jgi:hypothetical protein